jgi:hypothetical protein
MTQRAKPNLGRMIAVLRSGRAETKSYDVLGLCTRLDLAPDDGSVAHRGKGRQLRRQKTEMVDVSFYDIERKLGLVLPKASLLDSWWRPAAGVQW